MSDGWNEMDWKEQLQMGLFMQLSWIFPLVVNWLTT